MKVFKYKINIFFLMVIFMCLPLNNLIAKDVFTDLMKESVATFWDAAKLIYHSFNPIEYIKNREFEKERENNLSENQKNNLSVDEVKKYLLEQGFEIPTDNQPITRKQFAKTLLTRFELPTSLFTDIFGTDNMYFSDAIKLGIFSSNLNGNESITTRELLQSFIRAENISIK
ncbi:MAG: hypothetical protein OEZ22_11320 [Spirochaetia bacterium]|nr:hypothetical protein [Spirochaetia bacterium]